MLQLEQYIYIYMDCIMGCIISEFYFRIVKVLPNICNKIKTLGLQELRTTELPQIGSV